jgi:antitoxin component of MazEF toxin-antitoxin module
MAQRKKLSRAGNSTAVIIDKETLAELGFVEDIEVEIEDGSLVITPVRPPLSARAQARLEAIAARVKA